MPGQFLSFQLPPSGRGGSSCGKLDMTFDACSFLRVWLSLCCTSDPISCPVSKMTLFLQNTLRKTRFCRHFLRGKTRLYQVRDVERRSVSRTDVDELRTCTYIYGFEFYDRSVMSSKQTHTPANYQIQGPGTNEDILLPAVHCIATSVIHRTKW